MTYSFNLQPTPLSSWGVFKGQRRLSDSPYIESVWEGVAYQSGVHLTAADGTIDFTFRTRQGNTHLLLSGPTSKATLTTFEAGDEVLTIRLRTGVHHPFVCGTKLADFDTILSDGSSRYFWLQNRSVTFPDFDNIETFVERLARLHLLRRDIVVEDALAGKLWRTSLRTVQRHFLATTGLTMKHVYQIRRAEEARNLLSSGSTLASIAYETGYSNPAHMTNAFKYFFGQTPSVLRSLIASS